MFTATNRDADRVRRHTSPAAGQKIEAQTRRNVRQHAAGLPREVSRRIAALENEWDIERVLELNASTFALTGAVLGTTVNRKWFWLTGGVLTFLLQHAASGWCPPVPVLRKLGIRTRGEIDQEKFALKAVRGDFPDGNRARRAVSDAVCAVACNEPDPTARARREPDRVRRYTSRAQLQRLDAAMEKRLRLYAAQPAEVIDERIAELRREWSIERYLQINVAAVGLGAGVALAATKRRAWGLATCATLGLFMFHATEGFDPPLPALRRLGVRSRDEIDREIYALKILRGDFDELLGEENEMTRIETALAAVGL